MTHSGSKLEPDHPFRGYLVPQISLELVEEMEEVDAAAALVARLLPSLRETRSRFRRISHFIPRSSKSKSKHLEDAVLRKTAPPPLQLSSPDRLPPLPPKDTPITQNHKFDRPLPPPPQVGSPGRTRNSDSPNRLLPQLRSQSPARPISSYEPMMAKDPTNVPPPPPKDSSQTIIASAQPASRPGSSHNSGSDSESGLASKLRKRASWMPGSGSRSRSRNASRDSNGGNSKSAWIGTGGGTLDYPLTFLTNGEKVPELWTEDADTFVYLFPRSTGCGPSFRIPGFILSSSAILPSMMLGDPSAGPLDKQRNFGGRSSLVPDDANRTLPVRDFETWQRSSNAGQFGYQDDEFIDPLDPRPDTPLQNHLYFPTGLMTHAEQLSQEDVQKLVDIRNLFAFLIGQPLVGTKQNPETFGIFLTIANLLKEFQFSNIDGSSFGEAVETAFGFYHDELRLSDVRNSREKTLEGIVLGEHMRYTPLYNECFAHAVGKYDAIRNLNSRIFNLISPSTRHRLERAHMDLQHREASVQLRLSNFDFPSMFAGIASSTSSDESKYIPFKAWKLNFISMRRFVMGYYKDLHGQWPPKASSKKNIFVEGGLNRLVLKVLYNDFCQLYSLLVDRHSMTTRAYDDDNLDATGTNTNPTHAALRKLLSEYDRASPPVQPPIPFDVPLIPSVATVNPSYPSLSVKDQSKQSTRKLKENEMMLILTKCHNLDSDMKTPFLQAYKDFELSQSRGRNAQELANQRIGHWIFMYAVLQALPMLVIDAPGVRFTEAVEYFLCEPPMGGEPWLESTRGRTGWYKTQGTEGYVELPSDVVDHGVEAIYRRSFCFTVPQQWFPAENDPSVILPSHTEPEEMLSPLDPPPAFAAGDFGMRPPSGDRPGSSGGSFTQNFSNMSLGQLQPPAEQRSESWKKRQSLVLGLERLPIPGGVNPNLPINPNGSSPAPSVGSRQGSAGSRQGSAATQNSRQGSTTAATFDDILSSMAHPSQEKEGKGSGKKK